MLSKRSIHGASVAFFLDDMIDQAELQSILEVTNKKNPSFPHWYYDRIEGTLDDMSDSETKAEFRLTSSEFLRLAEALRIPEMFTCCNINEIWRLVNRAKEICLSLPFQTNISLFCNDTWKFSMWAKKGKLTLQCDAPYRGHPTNIFYKLANQGTRI